MSKPHLEIFAKRYGPLLFEQTPITLSVMGVFQHGFIAIGMNERQILYITEKDHPGPFSLYAPDFQGLLNKIRPHHKLIVNNNSIHIPVLNVQINLNEAIPYKRFVKSKRADLQFIKASLLSLKKSFSKLRNVSSDFMYSYMFQFGPFCLAEEINHEIDRTIDLIIKDFYTYVVERNISGLQETILKCLGLGQGLTPAGDDFLAGWLLANHIYQNESNRDSFCDSVSQFIIELAPCRTHLLSSGLIWAASQGETDPILREIVQHIMLGKHITTDDLNGLTKIGHSSGFDGLSGSLIYLESPQAKLSF